MQLTPRYGGDPLIALDGAPDAIGAVAVGQRRRLADTLASFDDDQWSHPSRCEGWSNRDVIVHLDSTNAFWTYSIAQGLAGEPTQFLAAFDPVASPAELVAASGDVSPREVLEKFVASNEALAAVLEPLGADDWSATAEAPPGHQSINAVVHHALWDSWVHERDILQPLDLPTPEVPNEVVACLRYAAALSPAFALSRRRAQSAVLAVEATDPDVAFVVDVGTSASVRAGTTERADLRLTGSAVRLVEALSVRGPLGQEVPAESAWMVGGLAEVFDSPLS